MALKPLNRLPQEPLRIKRALLSVSDKSGLLPLAKSLHEAGVELISTGGTARAIREEEIPVTDVSELTGFPECLDGRVKTLHPNVHAGLLARTSYQPDLDQMEELNLLPIELAVINLYPFEQRISDSTSMAVATEFIDIGGPTMIRASAKNFAHVSILTSPDQYEEFMRELKENKSIGFELRKQLAREAFNHTAHYDACIAEYFNGLFEEDNPPRMNISLPKSRDLRYGENPHQKAAVYGNQSEYIDCFHGKQLSYNNYLDLDAALNLISDFEDGEAACAILKHTAPCGVATDPDLTTAWEKAFSTDTDSPFGGIVVVNRELDLKTARKIDNIFMEIVIAPSFAADALELLQQKKNRRLVRLNQSVRGTKARQFRSIFGGALNQESDFVTEKPDHYDIVTSRKPDKHEMRDLLFAWKVVKHVKSNAIVYARDGQTVGIGTGQTSRVESSEVAIAKAKKEGLVLDKSVIASDAFFPFADGVEAAAKEGVTAVIQPGGSIRDDEVIEAADKHNLAMVFTGKRHFRH